MIRPCGNTNSEGGRNKAPVQDFELRQTGLTRWSLLIHAPILIGVYRGELLLIVQRTKPNGNNTKPDGVVAALCAFPVRAITHSSKSVNT